MNGKALLATLAVFIMAGLCPAQTQGERPERVSGEPSQLPKRVDQSTTESSENAAERAVDKIGEALENTGQAVRESLGLAKTGCLTQGDEADPFILIDDEGNRITVVGSADLPNHVDHRVTVHDSKEAEGRVFRVTNIDQVSTSCDTPVGRNSSREKHRNEPREETRVRDTPERGVTADDQGLSAADRQTTQAIRKAVTADETLSVYAKNVKVITRDGTVTLRGLVRTEEEKRNIETKAAAIAGAGNVRNQLTPESATPGR